MHRGVKIPWLGGRYIMVGGKNPKDRGTHIMYRGVKIPWLGGQITLYGGSKYHE
jgi:hypothetical protein